MHQTSERLEWGEGKTECSCEKPLASNFPRGPAAIGLPGSVPGVALLSMRR